MSVRVHYSSTRGLYLLEIDGEPVAGFFVFREAVAHGLAAVRGTFRFDPHARPVGR